MGHTDIQLDLDQPTDRGFVQYVVEEGLLTEEEVSAMVALWQEADSDISMCDYYVQQGVLVNTSAMTLRMIHSGLLNANNISSCFSARGLRAIRREVSQRMQESTADTAEPATLSPMVENEPPPLPDVGTMMGKYLFTHRIGAGASCLVFEAINQETRQPVAAKVFSPLVRKADSTSARRKFLEEAQILSWLDDPNIVKVLDFESGYYPTLIMEFVSGLSLAELIQQCGRVAVPQATQIICKALKALAHAHEHKVIHRDIKPANILLSRDGTVKLADLGIALIQSGFSEPGESSRKLIGTPSYIAPEQAVDPDKADERSDIYSMGATFYHALTGETPFQADGPQQMISQHICGDFRPPHHLCRDIPPRLSQVIEKMMQRHPEARYSQATELVHELKTMLENITAGPDSLYTPEQTQVLKENRSKGHDTTVTVSIKRSLVQWLQSGRPPSDEKE